MATVSLELYELFEKKLGKEEAKKAIKLVKEALEAVEQKAKEQKTIVKAELKDELRKEPLRKTSPSLNKKWKPLDKKCKPFTESLTKK